MAISAFTKAKRASLKKWRQIRDALPKLTRRRFWRLVCADCGLCDWVFNEVSKLKDPDKEQ